MKAVPLVLTLLMVIIIGCSGGGNPAGPNVSENPPDDPVTVQNNRILLNVGEVNISEDRQTVEVIPNRDLAMHLNILPLMQLCTDCIWFSDFQVYSINDFSCDLKLKHPLPEMPEFTLFDVRFIFMTDADYSFPASNRKIAWEPGTPRIMNPSGYTHFFNMAEFPLNNDNPYFSYFPGVLSTGKDLTATLNPFLAYATDNPRRMFESGAEYTRRARINAPAGPIKFAYAIDACWVATETWDDPVNDFPPEANAQETYRIDVDIPQWPEEGESAEISVRVFDHQGAETIGGVYIEAYGLFYGIKSLDLSWSEEDIAVYTGSLPNDLGALEGSIPILIGVASTEEDPNFGPLVAWQVYIGDITNVADYAVIGSSGGVVRCPGATLTIPAGALEEEHIVYLGKDGTTVTEPEAISGIYTFGVQGFDCVELNEQAILEIQTGDLDDYPDPSCGLSVYDTWVPLPMEEGPGGNSVVIRFDSLPPVTNRQGQSGIFDNSLELGPFKITIFGIQGLSFLGSSEHFTFYSDFDIDPEYLQEVGECADRSLEFLCDVLGFLEPNWYAGFTNPLMGFNNGKHYAIILTDTEGEAAPFIYQGFIKINKSEPDLKEIQAGTCHELFHLVQMRYWVWDNPWLDNWVVEGTAAMMGGWAAQHFIQYAPGYPPIGQYDDFTSTYDYPIDDYSWYQFNKRLQDGLIASGGTLPYRSQVFYGFLTRQCGSGFMKKLMEELFFHCPSILHFGDSLWVIEHTALQFKQGQWDSITDAFINYSSTQFDKGYFQDIGEDGVLGELPDDKYFENNHSGPSNCPLSLYDSVSVNSLGDRVIKYSLNQGIPGNYKFTVTTADGYGSFGDPQSCLAGYWACYNPSDTTGDNIYSNADCGNKIPSSGIFTVQVDTPDEMYVSIYLGNARTNDTRHVYISCEFTQGQVFDPVDVTPTDINSVVPDICFDGNYAYILTDSGVYLKIFDISNPLTPILVNILPCTSSGREIAIENGYAYVVSTNGLQIIDISSPHTAFTVKDFSQGGGRSLAVQNGYVYTSYRIVIDVDPPEDAWVVNIWSGSNASIYSMKIQDGLLYFYYNTDWPVQGLAIYSLNDPALPVFLCGEGFGSGVSSNWALNGNYAYFWKTPAFSVYEITLPDEIELIGQLDLPYASKDIEYKDGYVFLTTQYDFRVIDVTSPTAPNMVLTKDVPGPTYNGIIRVYDNYAYVGANYGLDLFDISIPEAAKFAGEFGSIKFGGQDVAIDGDLAYYEFSGGSRNLSILNIGKPEATIYIGNVDLPYKCQSICVDNGYAYVTCISDNYFHIIDVDPYETAHIVKSIALPTLGYDVAVDGEYAYVANYSCGIQIIDINPPETAAIIKTIDTPSQARGIKIENGYAYIADYSAALIMDIDPIGESYIMKSITTPGNAMNIDVSNGYAYVADFSYGLCIIDIDPINSAAVIKNVDTPGASSDVVLDELNAYIADGSHGLQIISCNTPESAFLAGALDTPESAIGIDVSGPYAYIAQNTGGLRIIKMW